jgi:AraC-like DNA-binding protein
MIRTARPAVDPRIVPVLGMTRDGQPLSYNRAPAPDLAGWIGRLSVSKLSVGSERVLSCGLFPDTAGMRIQLAGDFEIETGTGIQHHGTGALFYGPQSKRMSVRVVGDFISIGVTFRPSACAALLKGPMPSFVDQAISVKPWLTESLLTLFAPDISPEAWLRILEDLLRSRIAELGGLQPDPISARFEEIAFVNPAMSITQAAREIDVDRRRLERIVVRDFGMSPKQVLKRARALDMASYLRGVADGDEAEALALRYYDESHLIREFIDLFGMSPRQFTALPQPLLTLNLEVRQARRLEMINRLEPGARRPWE